MQGGTIAKPEDSTAAGEFIIKGVPARALAQSLGFHTAPESGVKSVMASGGKLSAQLAATAPDELRVLVAVTRSKSGINAGRKKAVATFVWGNQKQKIMPFSDLKTEPGVTLDLYPNGDDSNPTRYTGGLDLMVEYPNFQDKTTRSGAYVADTGPMCARVVIDLRSVDNVPTNPDPRGPMTFNNLNSPLEVCEGTTEQNAERAALEKYADGVLYDLNSFSKTPFDFQRSLGQTALPDAAELQAQFNVTGSVSTGTLDEFFAPLIVLPAGDPENWTTEEKAEAATARKYQSLKKQFGYYYRATQVYYVTNADGTRKDIFILGLNGWGVGGLHTIQFPVPQAN